MSSTLPVMSEGLRHATVTVNDHGAILQIVAWFMMVAMILMVSLRLAIRFTAIRIAGWDDTFVVIAMLFSISNTVAISLAVNHGLGKREDIRDEGQVTTLEKCIWSGSILYLLAISLAKLSTLSLIARLSPNHFHAKVIRSTFALVVFWAVASIFASAFQCSLTKPWDIVNENCFDVIAFWTAVGSIDILIDIMLVALPYWIVEGLQMRKKAKSVVILAFACRVMVIITTIVRLVFLNKLRHSKDPFWDSINFQIVTQCQQTFAVIVACAPSLKIYADHTISGMLNLSLAARTGATYGQDSHRMTRLSTIKSGGSNQQGGRQDSEPSVAGAGGRDFHRQLFHPKQFRTQSAITTGQRDSITEDRADDLSLTSHASDQQIIRVRRDWSVEAIK